MHVLKHAMGLQDAAKAKEAAGKEGKEAAGKEAKADEEAKAAGEDKKDHKKVGLPLSPVLRAT